MDNREENERVDLWRVILFYKFVDLTLVENEVASSLRKIASELGLQGRLLVSSEGVNGTLSGAEALVGRFEEHCINDTRLNFTASDFRASFSTSSPFSRLHVKVTEELCWSGRILKDIPISETGKGYLTPDEWRAILDDRSEDLVILDVRSQKESSIGKFEGAVVAPTRTFAEYHQWLASEESQRLVNGKKVLMYCTGGLRCEKTAARLRATMTDSTGPKSVQHLEGGVHRYLERFCPGGTEKHAINVAAMKNSCTPTCMDDIETHWKGKNFVFDRRGSVGGDGFSDAHVNFSDLGAPELCVGTCSVCRAPYDCFENRATQIGTSTRSKVTCAVCDDAILVCLSCRASKHSDAQSADDEFQKFFCLDHTKADLPECQRDSDMTIQTWSGKKTRRRKRNERQSHLNRRARAILEESTLRAPAHAHRMPIAISGHEKAIMIRVPPPCVRHIQATCKGRWEGKHLLDVCIEEFGLQYGTCRQLWEARVQAGLLSVERASIIHDHKAHLGASSGSENTLLGNPILRCGDVIRHTVHWHEPPVVVPDRLHIQIVRNVAEKLWRQKWGCGGLVSSKGAAEDEKTLGKEEEDERDIIYVIDKPSTLPVTPVGNYLCNSLLPVLESQLELPPRSVSMLHRLDRLTSGVCLAAEPGTPSAKALLRLFSNMGEGETGNDNEHCIVKTYIARVSGRFPDCASTAAHLITTIQKDWHERAKINWLESSKCLTVSASIIREDNSHDSEGKRRRVGNVGENKAKPSVSMFSAVDNVLMEKLLQGKRKREEIPSYYDESTNSSLIWCRPVTGRTHQLRIHLASVLGFPIIGDNLYSNIEPRKGCGIDQPLKQSSAGFFDWGGADHNNIQQPEDLCIHCTSGGAEAMFSSEQLRTTGICLHSLRIECTSKVASSSQRGNHISDGKNHFPPTHLGSSGIAREESHGSAALMFEVPPPTWVDASF